VPVFALRLAYDGGGFSGWARQAGKRTVAGEVDAACARLDPGPGTEAARCGGASRTDAGVHARGQVARVELARAWAPKDLARALGRHLPEDITCMAAAAVADEWDPVANAGKVYRYRIHNGPLNDPFQRQWVWRPPFRLDLADLQEAAAGVAGRRDWRAFARRGETRTASVRTIHACLWEAEGVELVCTVVGEGFTYRLVRSLVGAMVAVAHGSCTPEAFAQALAGKASPAGTQQAPARGLCLEQVLFASGHEPEWVGVCGE
jgi:tRNA pseudouridine38-40 synthase